MWWVAQESYISQEKLRAGMEAPRVLGPQYHPDAVILARFTSILAPSLRPSSEEIQPTLTAVNFLPRAGVMNF